MKRIYAQLLAALALLLGLNTSCIEPPLHLAEEEDVVIDLPIVQTEMEIVWNVDVDWRTNWYYGWDTDDEQLYGSIDYPDPTNFEIRRYFIGQTPKAPHTREGLDGFTLFAKRFRRNYQFGYYDLLFWSNIDSKDGTQVLLVNESDLDEVTATTTVTRGFAPSKTESRVTGLYNQPEIFYSAYEQGIHISHDIRDYDYFDEEVGAWVKNIKTELTPLVYIYLVQVVLHNNDGRVTGITGDGAISAMASGTSVNTAHTNNSPCMVYFPMRMKTGREANGERVDIVGGKFTTFGLCDMDGYRADTRAEYQGSRTDIDNRLYVTLRFSNDTEQTYDFLITDQCRKQCHGGVITVDVDCSKIEPPKPDTPGSGNVFVPTIEDYDHVDYEIPM